MKITYDKSVDVAYIYLRDIELRDSKKTYTCDLNEVDGMINLDFDEDSKLIGIEVIDAKTKLPVEILAEAEIIG